MMRLPPTLRAVLVVACAASVSCTSLLRTVQHRRVETVLSKREKHHLGEILGEMTAGWEGMQHGKISERREAQDQYDRALTRFLREWDDAQSPRYWQSGTVFEAQKQSFAVKFDSAADPQREVPPPKVDEIILPHRVKPRVADTLAQRTGVGVPIVGHIRRTSGSRQEQPFLPPNGGNLTLTATMEIGEPAEDGRSPRHCHLRFHNSLNVDTVRMRDDERQLAANFTASKHLALSKKTLNWFAWLGLFLPERALKDCQLYMMDGYDPDRVPVVFVHGLMSDPHIWLNMVNAISADPQLRAVYQPWYFLYPTAIGIPQSSERLRSSLREALEHYDPDHNDPGPKKMVLVGHSMGGLLSRMQVIDPKDKLWNALFSQPPEKLNVSTTVKNRLENNLMFQPQPEVKRLVFIATPHRGSNLAGNNFIRRLTSLIRLPVDTLRMSQELLSGNTDALSPEIRDWGVFGFLSIGMLSDKHPFYKGLNAVPIPVAHHSIIGDRGRNHGVNGSDAVVPYCSAHLDSAKSEKIVPYWHGCVERPEVVQEVIRVLRVHLRENGNAVKKRS